MYGGAPPNAIGKLPFPASVVNTDAGNEMPKSAAVAIPLPHLGAMRS
jgi:hypothetical protein